MRILDTVHQHLDGVTRLVDLTPAELDLPGQLHLPEQVEVVREVAGPYGAGDLVAVVLGGHPELPTDAAAAHDALRSLEVGARALVLAGAEGRDFAFHRLLATAVASMLQVRQVAGFERLWPRTGVVLEAVQQPRPPVGYYGEVPAAVPPQDEARAWLRLQNEYVLADYVARGTRAALIDLQDRAGTRRAGREQVEDLQHRNGVLAGELREATDRLRQAERRIATIESSTSMRVGSAVVEAARRPGRSSLQLPKNLYRSWRARGVRPAAPGQPAADVPDPVSAAQHFLSHTAMAPGPRRRLLVAGILTDRTADLLAPSCDLVRLLPNDALALVERTDPDLLLVEAAAARPGQPWAHLAGPYAPERARELLAAADAAHGARRPVVLWRNVPHAEVPGLVRLAAQFDLVTSTDDSDPAQLRWSPGVQLAVFNPVGAAARAGVVARGSLDPRLAPRDRTAIEELAVAAADPDGSRVLPDPAAIDPAPWPEAVRRRVERAADLATGARALRGAVVGTSAAAAGALPDEALEVLASGCRVVLPGGEVARDLPADLAGLVHVVDGTAPAGEVVARALAAGPVPDEELRRVLRVLADEHSVPARLRLLVAALGLDPAPVGPSVAVLAHVADAAGLEALTSALLGQRERPRELLLDAAADLETGHARTELAEAGLTVRRGPTAPGAAATLTGCEWLLPWDGTDGPWDGDHLADLLVAAQLAEADAVGFGPGAGLRFVDALPWSGSLVRTAAAHRWGEPADGDLRGWARSGARLLALSPAADDRPTDTETA